MSTPLVQPYLFFGGNCAAALEFYRTNLGAQVAFLMHYKDCPEPCPPGLEEKVMHATFHIGETTLMAADGCEAGVNFNGFMLSLTMPDEADAQRVFTALAEGGQVRMPLQKTFWTPCFGTVVDRFGMGWMVTIPGPTP